MKLKIGQLNKIKNILFHYGAEHQKQKCIEELNELKQAITGEILGLDTRGHIIEEYADVAIMLEQLKIMHHITDDEIVNIIDFKLNRQLKRIKDE